MATERVKTEKTSYADKDQWAFWIDRGGTFTDVIAKTPDADLKTHKLLSVNPDQYRDAAVQGIRDLMGVTNQNAIPIGKVREIKVGTTVATNALLERKGEPTVFVATQGFGDALAIGYQNRPDIFALDIRKPAPIHSSVVEARERIDHDGTILSRLDEEKLARDLKEQFRNGVRGVAISFMHGYRFPEHEQLAARLAEEIGFTQISVSHEVSPLIKYVPRADTTVVDAYLSPVLMRYVDQLLGELSPQARHLITFMQSNGGLADIDHFRGKNAILSGPAGGVVGMVETAGRAGRSRVIGFDMGGTSTDVSHYAGTYERVFDSEVSGVRLSAPMMRVETIAAGGGSILEYDGMRMRVGPHSAGAYPGPAAYRNGGPLTVTDANIMVGKIDPDNFPEVFGPLADQSLDKTATETLFSKLAGKIGDPPEIVADGFIQIAVQNMAASIRKISVQRGYDVSEYVLNCFGGAGAQHACLVADALGISEILVHPFASVLSAYGIGLAVPRTMREASVDLSLSEDNFGLVAAKSTSLTDSACDDLIGQGCNREEITSSTLFHLRYEGTDRALPVAGETVAELHEGFEGQHKDLFGFVVPDRGVIIDSVSVESTVEPRDASAAPRFQPSDVLERRSAKKSRLFTQGRWHEVRHVHMGELGSGEPVRGPALLIDPHTTIVVEPDWTAVCEETADGGSGLYLRRTKEGGTSGGLAARLNVDHADPVALEIFSSLFMSIAEQMGFTLQNTAVSVNIKERLDFSCALFTPSGSLVANAPHIPVHLGSMGASVKSVLMNFSDDISVGDAFVLNDPFQGGTHLPDVTVVAPVFDDVGSEVLFFVAARGHHAEIGGISPGSMPALSSSLAEEGILIPPMKLVEGGTFREDTIRDLLGSGAYPSRMIDLNIADLKAQCAACEKGARELRELVRRYGRENVHRYMQYVQDNAEECVRRAIAKMKPGTFRVETDDERAIQVSVQADKQTRTAVVDFEGTSPQTASNFNAPSSITRAALLYVLRCLVSDDIPLNDGCLVPVTLKLPKGCFLNPSPPAPIVAGNVETSQHVCDALFGALGILASSHGTMNNVSFGNATYQYYETICGGAGAGNGFGGADAVQTHMTNSRLTDPEILESRFPVTVEEFSIRRASGGAGRWRGGCGATRHLTFKEAMSVSLLSSNRVRGAFGLSGGLDGQTGKNLLNKKDGSVCVLAACERVDVDPGDSLVVHTPGGGGFGKPGSP